MSFPYLTYRTHPPCSALRCQPMGTWTGTACLSSPASQSFPPFIAPLVLRLTPQRYMYQTWTSVFAMCIMFCLLKPWGLLGGWAFASTWDSALRWSWWGGGRVVRQAHNKPYPLTCFMATVLNEVWTSIAESCCSEPSDWLKNGRVGDQEWMCAVLTKNSLFQLILQHLSTDQKPVPQLYMGSQFTILVPKNSWGGFPMVPRKSSKRQKVLMPFKP